MGAIHRLLEQLDEVLARLSDEASRGVPVVVEGRSDVEALRSLGINGHFVVAKADSKPVADLALELASRASEVIVLTDFDAAGREQAFLWALELERVGVKANLAYWRCLMGLVGSFAKDIESLPSLIETLMRKAGYKPGKGKVVEIDTCTTTGEISCET